VGLRSATREAAESETPVRRLRHFIPEVSDVAALTAACRAQDDASNVDAGRRRGKRRVSAHGRVVAGGSIGSTGPE
jgi:hypothetical protein